MVDNNSLPGMQENIVGAAEGPPPHIQDFIFVRELSEVYLLLDHISGRWDKTFPQREPGAIAQNNAVSIQDICKIGWPAEGSKVEQAEQAATLLMAKDRLNGAAKPANGASIAFTLMVVGEENQRIDYPDLPVQANAAAKKGWLGEYKTPPTRIYLAHRAFPGLISSAAQFQKRIRRLVVGLSLFLLLTCALSWYVAAGNIILTHLDAVHLQVQDLKKKVGLMVTGSMAEGLKTQKTQDVSNPLGLLPVKVTMGVAYSGDPAFSAEACRAYFEKTIDRSKSAEPFLVCDALGEKMEEHAAVSANLNRWLPQREAIGNTRDDEHAKAEEFSRILTQVLVSSVLPFFYGILGAGAAVVRDLWAKMRESLLSPRDYTLAIGQLSLGAVIGACISLFISPTIAGAPNENILGSFILTGSALSFVAGFGVEGVFQALESLVRRIFNSTDPTKRV
jgi:hypothetical protein